MLLSTLLENVATSSICGRTDQPITGLAMDSRTVASGYAFVALRGTLTDGHQYIDTALERGALAIIHTDEVAPPANCKATFVRVAQGEAALAEMAANFYGHPSRRLRLVGVTGTNGKTTIATLLYQLFRAMGHKVGLLSTVCNYIDDEAVAATHTTPNAIALNALLSRMVEAGCDYAFMECSSHAIAQQRIGALRFEGGIFTNLTRDHLDYHGTFDAYRDAKKAFFDALPRQAFALTNADDRNGAVMLQNCAARALSYSTRSAADFHGRIIEESIEGMLLSINGQELSVPFVGRFNVSNLLAVYGAALALGKEQAETLRLLSTLRPVSGRFETLRSPLGFSAVVDYAHTPDALANVLSTLAEIQQGRGRILTLCGAGGNRDKGKRPLMAQTAARAAERLILTSDNPRDEQPEDILADMLAGLSEEERARTLVIADRREAIRTATMLAQPGDVILVAGKGHETYQEVRGVRHHFDDREEIRKAFGLC